MLNTVLMTTFLLIGVLITMSISGCNTIEGVGKDIKGGGKSLEEKAKKENRESTENSPTPSQRQGQF